MIATSSRVKLLTLEQATRDASPHRSWQRPSVSLHVRATRHSSTDFAAEARHTAPAIVRICCCTCVGGCVPVYSSRIVTACAVSPDTHPSTAVSRCILTQVQARCAIRQLFASHEPITSSLLRIGFEKHTASRRNFLHACPQAPAITQECRLLPLSQSPFLRMSVLVKSPLVFARSPLLPHALRSDR